jgi:hypothetical protein
MACDCNVSFSRNRTLTFSSFLTLDTKDEMKVPLL